jgi:16S rRNA (cytidine1402-2'-O)-methyltransferase
VGTLFLVATPIGNLEDISMRALRVLREARLVAAEDTRQTQKLLNRYEITPPRVLSYHEHNQISRLDEILGALAEGDVALVSDAGTPGLNDPGYELVRAALTAGFQVSCVPGASAPLAALVASGLPTDSFAFFGYLPRRRVERRRRLEEVAQLPYTLIFLETPHRLVESLADMAQVLGGNRPLAVARELTKLHEEILRGTVAGAQNHFSEVEPRGEFTLVVGGAEVKDETWTEERLEELLRAGVKDGETTADLAERAAKKTGWKKKLIYQRILALKRGEA